MSTSAPPRLATRRAKKKVVAADAPVKRRMNVPQMMGSSEVAEALDVKVQNLQFIQGLPRPVQRIRATRLWLASDIKEFSRQQRRRHRPAA